jgi:hypothetical protein
LADNFNSKHHQFGCGKLEPEQRSGMSYFLVKHYAEHGVGFEVTAENRQEFIRVRSAVI